MTTAILTASDRRARAEESREALRRFLKDSESQFAIGDCTAAGGELAIRLADDPRQARAERRALSAQIGAQGAYSVPQTFAGCCEEALLYASPLRDAGTTVSTERGGAWHLPTIDDTSSNGVIVPENALPAGGEQDITTFGSLILYTQKFSSNWILFPQELLEDAGDLLTQRIAGVLGRRIGRLQNATWTPQIMTSATLGVTAASSTAIAADELIVLFHSIDPAYREQPGFCFQMNNATLQYVRQIKDSSGRYLFKNRKKPGKPGTILGARVYVNRDMAGIATGNFSVACGDFSKVVIRDVGREIRIRSTTERWADFDQTGVIGFMRSEGTLMDAGTHPIKYLKHP